MLKLRVLDLDGSLAAQPSLFVDGRPVWIPSGHWGRRIRLACSFKTFRQFRQWLAEQLVDGEPGITLYGSGDFHHVTLALLNRLSGPFNLLVLDKHPDWMRGIPFLHCGTWLRHALELPNLHRVFHCGGELDFDNAYRYLAPWDSIASGRIVVYPAQRQFQRGRWGKVNVHPLMSKKVCLADALDDALVPFRAELGEVPLYISIDKDVLAADDAAVNWDSGLLRLADVVTILERFLEAAGGRLAGADLLGDWSPIVLGHWLNRLCDRLDHPSPQHDPSDAAARNLKANQALIHVLSKACFITRQGAARK